MRIILWNPLMHTTQENLNWCLARAVEWDDWPVWVSLPIAPILFTFVSWAPVTVTVLICNVLWWPVKLRWISLRLAELVGLLSHLKWPISVASGGYLFFQGENGKAAVALLWPVLVIVAKFPAEVVMSARGWTPQVGKLQNLFMRKLGFEVAE